MCGRLTAEQCSNSLLTLSYPLLGHPDAGISDDGGSSKFFMNLTLQQYSTYCNTVGTVLL